MTATKRNGLYIFDVKPTIPTAHTATHLLDKPVNMDSWHRCYAHASLKHIRESFTKSLVDGGIVSGGDSREKCVPCVHGNGVRQPFDAEVVTMKTPLA